MMNRRFAISRIFIGTIILVSLLRVAYAQNNANDAKTKPSSERLDIYGDPLPPGALARFGSLRLKHSQPGVHTVCYSPDGKMIASGGEDKTVRLWEAETGKPIHVFEAHRHPVTSVAISPKGDILAAGDESGALMIWKLSDYKLLYGDFGLGRGDIKLAFAPDGATLAAVDQRSRALFLIPTDTPFRAKRIPVRNFGPMWAAWSPDGKTISLLGSGSNKRRDLLVIDPESGEVLAEPQSEPMASFPKSSDLVFSSTNEKLITGDFFLNTRPDYGSGLTVWKRTDDNLEEIRRIAPGKKWGPHCTALSHHPKEPLVAYYRGDSLIIQNWKTLEVVGIAVTDRVWTTAFSPDGQHLATAGAMLRVWTVPDLKPVFEYHPDSLPVSFSKDSRQAAVGNLLWDLKTHRPLYAAENAYTQMGHTHFATRSRYIAPPNGVRIVDGEKIFAYSFNRQHLLVTAIEHAKQLVDFRLPKESEPNSFGINYVDFSEDMERVVFQTSQKEQGRLLRTIRISDGDTIRRFTLPNPNSQWGFALSPNGETLAATGGSTTSNSCELNITDTTTGITKKLIEYDDDHLLSDGKLCFSKSGKHVALCFPHTRSYLTFSIPNGKQVLSVLHPVANLTDPLAHPGRLGEPAFSEDGRWLAVGEGDFTSERPINFQAKISVWDLKTRKRLWTQDWGSELPHKVVFLGDQLLAVGKRLAMWDASSGRLLLDKTGPVEKSGDSLLYQAGIRSPNGKLLLAGRSDGVTELIDINRGKQVDELTAHRGVPVESYHFPPNSEHVIVPYQDRTALLWDLPAIAKRAP